MKWEEKGEVVANRKSCRKKSMGEREDGRLGKRRGDKKCGKVGGEKSGNRCKKREEKTVGVIQEEIQKNPGFAFTTKALTKSLSLPFLCTHTNTYCTHK